MELEGVKVSVADLKGAPPLLPWQVFAEWIGMGNDEQIVWGWIRKGYIPRYKIGTHVMVNVALLSRRLLDEEGI
ncbi:DNA-binding protein [Pseudomonas aeruginosa]|nr:DNA-binding protein [Pseudomonas aeruginosa]MDI4007168.1 DNA-binding protein [Pseudomonas aeruginosa]